VTISLALLACESNFAGDSGAQTETAAVTLDGVSGVISITEGDAEMPLSACCLEFEVQEPGDRGVYDIHR
jgi:hypothetical protein